MAKRKSCYKCGGHVCREAMNRQNRAHWIYYCLRCLAAWPVGG